MDVATFDIPGAYIYTETYKDVTMLLEEAIADLMMKLFPNIYQKYIIMSSKGKPLLYVKIQNALYGLLSSGYCSTGSL